MVNEQDSRRFNQGSATFCGVHTLWGVGIDHLGNLQMCWEAVDKPELSFGTAREWDPARPLATASRPDNLTCYLSGVGAPATDPECRACVWLPLCAGGCPYARLFGDGRVCVPYKDDPEAFVLKAHAWRKKQKEQGASPAAPDAKA